MPPRSALRQPYRPTAERRREIAAAAVSCLSQNGYAALTARRVAAAAGLSLGHITYHFRDMDDLLAEAYQLASAQLRTATAAALPDAGRPAAEHLEAFLHAGFSPGLMTRSYLRLRIDLWSAALAHPALARTEAALYETYRQDLATLLARMTPDADSRSNEIVAASDAIMAMLDGLWLDWMRRSDQTAIDNGLAACMAIARTLA